ncbi:InlB B-repeat-containing protein [Atopobiaceae bacterium 24-176]
MLEKIRKKASRHLGRLYALAVCTLLAFIGLVGSGALTPAYGAVDVGANPTPKVDIAVTVPADYPGTFLDFKQELTQKLIDQGMDPSAFRITNTDVSIDTTDLSGWLVRDHYRDQATYNSIVPAEQRANQPFRQADNSQTNGTGTIESYFKNNTNTTGNACKNFDRHIYSSVDNEGKSSMVFAGYGTQALSDYMIYPASSDSRRTFSFDINPAVIDTHTLGSYGFWLNAGIENNTVSGYALVFKAGSNACTLRKISAGADSVFTESSGTQIATVPTMNFGPKNMVRVTVELNKNSVTMQYQSYDASGNLGDPVNLLKNQPLDNTGFNGFGPLVNYVSHGCSSLSIMKFSDLEMSYAASAFDALKNTQYFQGAEQKYFINLAGDSNDPQIPDEFGEAGGTNPDYTDGINRLNENEIFYISNAQDGQIVTDSTKDGNGDTTHQGLGSDNGFIAMGDDYVTEIAEYIYKNFVEGKKFNQAPISSELPLANFYIVNSDTDEQLMTVHLQHLVNTNGTVPVNMVDRSMIGTLSGADGKLTQWHWTVYDPSNNKVFDKTYADPSQIEDYLFTKDSAHGRWTFELTVTDDKGNVSKISQTYVTAYLDNEEPFIEGANTGKNVATITLTDTGEGIDEDGITFIEDGRGSGVAAYWWTNDPSYATADNTKMPPEDAWEVLPFPQHEFSFEYEIASKDPLIVFVRDECGNIGSKAVFQPTHVRVEDENGNPIDDYYVIGEKPIIVLPEDEDVPDPEDDPDNNKFSGWTTPGGDPVTPGTTPEPEDNEIIIRPSYSKDYAKLIYLANGGDIEGKPSSEYQVVSKSSILKKIDDHDVTPTREGYSFKGWKLLNTDDGTKAADSTYINTAANVADIVDQLAVKEVDESTGAVKRDTYYLVAQWEVGNYTIHFDANGGSLGNVRSIADVAYGANVGAQGIPVSGRGVPTKPGYIFQGWSTSKNAMDDTTGTFAVATGVSGITAVPAPTMPARDITVYAVWKFDTSKFIVSFDSAGGSRVNDVAYPASTTNSYSDNQATGFTFKVPSRPGYDFTGWHLLDAGTGELAETPTVGTEAVASKTNHTYVATWAPRDDTRYTVEYWVNSGSKDADGNAVYTRVTDTSVTKTYTAATESAVAVSDADKTPEITVDGSTYWYNAANANNVLEGTVTGSPTLALRLYYDRYLDVNVTANDPDGGTVSSAKRQKEGTTPTVSWKANDGWHVKSVTVDGVVRDDLRDASGYTCEDPLTDDVNIRVVFEKDSEDTPAKPSDPSKPKPENTFYSIKTRVEGVTDPAECTVTGAGSVKMGTDAQVTWTLRENSRYRIAKVTVDGEDVDISTGGVDFKNVNADHEVVVTLSTLPSLGGTDVVTEDKYTLTVNRYGGDDKVKTSHTMTVSEGARETPSWDATASDWQIVKVVIDGDDVTSQLSEKQLQKCTWSKAPFNKGFTANHVVDIYMAEPQTDDEGNPVDPVIPDYTDPDQFVTITTKLVGATGDVTGSITGGAVVKKDSGDYGVNWGLQTSEKDVMGNLSQGEDGYFYGNDKNGDGKYVCYELEKVVVDGKEIEKDADGNVTVPTDKSSTVEVYVRPVLHTVTIRKYGDGEVSDSKTVYHLDDYKDIYGKEVDSKLARVVLDQGTPDERELFFDDTLNFDQGDSPATQSDEPTAAETQVPVQPEQKAGRQDVPQAAPVTELVDPVVVPDPEPAEETPEPATEPAEEAAAEQAPEAQPETASDPEVAPQAADAEVVPAMARLKDFRFVQDIYRPATSTLMTVRADGNGNATYTNDQITGLNQMDISKDHTLDFYFVKQATNPDGTPKEDPDGNPIYEPIPDELVNVSAKLVGGEGTVLGNATIKKGTTTDGLKVIPASGYEVVGAKDQNGNEYTVKDDGTIELPAEVNGDIQITVSLKPKPVTNDNDPKPNEFDPEDPDNPSTYTVTATTQGGVGTISGAGEVARGDSRTVSWAPGEGETVKYVFVDGKPRPDLLTADHVDLEPNMDHHVTVVFATSPRNIDKDGDGKPDLNVDPDDDGKPDTNVDTDGDGEPDLNVDPDGDGKPDTNIVDEDGDGKPDPVDIENIDPDNPPKPTVNVDPDGDGVPDINVDTDGDGIPDVNIVDEDHDGKPDPVDPKNPPKPNINIVDTDGDGKPDPVDPKDPDSPKIPTTNIDTDGDGKPDLNVDTDGDGKPDLNIVDKDGDGKPDPVDPKSDPLPEPDVNVDTDGDGWPDINIDTDGDGRPDKNVDTNGDRVYDWKDEGHPQHQDYLDSIKGQDPNGGSNGANGTSTSKTTTTTTTTTRRLPFTGGMPVTGDVASVAPALGSLGALALAATGAVVLRRKRRDDD